MNKGLLVLFPEARDHPRANNSIKLASQCNWGSLRELSQSEELHPFRSGPKDTIFQLTLDEDIANILPLQWKGGIVPHKNRKHTLGTWLLPMVDQCGIMSSQSRIIDGHRRIIASQSRITTSLTSTQQLTYGGEQNWTSRPVHSNTKNLLME